MNYTILIMALLGLVINVGKKYKSGLDLAKAANANFNPSVYFQKDWFSLLVSVVAIIIAGFSVPEIQNALPERYQGVLKFLFAAVGYSGGDILIYVLNKSRKLTLGLIDKKTDFLNYEIQNKPAGAKDDINDPNVLSQYTQQQTPVQEGESDGLLRQD